MEFGIISELILQSGFERNTSIRICYSLRNTIINDSLTFHRDEVVMREHNRQPNEHPLRDLHVRTTYLFERNFYPPTSIIR